ncbi:hypothetical protein bcCo53_001209 (plasmid) [Borrelia coriaceae]|uniref:Mlp lipoprotein family protein n=1 Tax=Borrelia coriaceae ATCC 43381 TaxID=1408429 RepID=W5SW12_9SPIR|nr:hypothetical protein [Borrelia coriaceae]AHH11082.1 hypothetical protein BCO_0002000 [Borrelia coriaceae ATCC 43381]UPA17040.1 hypothetical protein bcCo53_001209 [Borrelia coriaceae]
MKLFKVLSIFLSVLVFSCNLSDFFNKDDLDGNAQGMRALLQNGLRALINGANSLEDEFEDDEDYEYYIDEDGNIVYVEYETVEDDELSVIETQGGADVAAASGVVIAGASQGAVTTQVAGAINEATKLEIGKVGPALQPVAQTMTASVVAQPAFKPVIKSVPEPVSKPAVTKVVAQPSVQNNYRSSYQYIPRRSVSQPQHKAAERKVIRQTVVCMAHNKRRGDGEQVVISDDEKRKLDRLEEYLKDVIKVSGKQSKCETAHQKFFTWLRTKDIACGARRIFLARDMKKVYDLIKLNASRSSEIQTLVSYGVNGNSEILREAGIRSASDIKSDAHVEALIKCAVSSKECAGTALSLFFQSLANSFDNCYDDSDSSFERIHKKLENLFNKTSYTSGGFEELQSKISN